MYVCNCHPFSDKDVKAYCADQGAGKAIRLIDVYRACSGVSNPKCGSCVDMLKEMVAAHNDSVARPSAATITPQSTPPKPPVC